MEHLSRSKKAWNETKTLYNWNRRTAAFQGEDDRTIDSNLPERVRSGEAHPKIV